MKIKVKHIKSEEVLEKFGNQLFTKQQLKEIASA